MTDNKKNKKKKSKEIGKVNPILFKILYAVLKPIYTKKYGITYDNEIVKDIKGPAIVVATHTSNVDHILSAITLYPVRPTYIVSEHFMRNKKTAMLLKLAHVITKKMFTPDVSTIINVMRAKKENAVIVIFAEGRLSCFGRTLPIAEGTAELIKKLGVNLYSWKAEGAYLSIPKWSEKGGERRGKIKSSVKLLLTAEEIAERSIDEIKEITAKAVYNDDELVEMLIVDKILKSSDDIEKKIIDALLDKCTIEQIAEKCFLTVGGVKYRINKIIAECGAKNREEIISLLDKYIYRED